MSALIHRSAMCDREHADERPISLPRVVLCKEKEIGFCIITGLTIAARLLRGHVDEKRG
jgi:hypothetical protein